MRKKNTEVQSGIQLSQAYSNFVQCGRKVATPNRVLFPLHPAICLLVMIAATNNCHPVLCKEVR